MTSRGSFGFEHFDFTTACDSAALVLLACLDWYLKIVLFLNGLPLENSAAFFVGGDLTVMILLGGSLLFAPADDGTAFASAGIEPNFASLPVAVADSSPQRYMTSC